MHVWSVRNGDPRTSGLLKPEGIEKGIKARGLGRI